MLPASSHTLVSTYASVFQSSMWPPHRWTTDKGSETHVTVFAQRFEARQQPAPANLRRAYSHRYLRSSRQSGVERFNGEINVKVSVPHP